MTSPSRSLRDGRGGGCFDRPSDAAPWAASTSAVKPLQEFATPGANSVAAIALVRMTPHRNESLPRLRQKTLEAFAGIAPAVRASSPPPIGLVPPSSPPSIQWSSLAQRKSHAQASKLPPTAFTASGKSVLRITPELPNSIYRRHQ